MNLVSFGVLFLTVKVGVFVGSLVAAVAITALLVDKRIVSVVI